VNATPIRPVFTAGAAALIIALSSATHGAAAATLTFGEAIRLALDHQPVLEAQEAAIRAAREDAVAEGELPDPKLAVGLKDLPIEDHPAFTLDRDDFTMLAAELSQEFPRVEKRRLRGERGRLEAEAGEYELSAMQREIRRDAGLSWLDLHYFERALEPTRALAREYRTQRAATEIAVRTDRASQAELLGAAVEAALLEDRIRALQQARDRTRADLSRWIGAEAAEQPVALMLPKLDPAPPLEEILAAIREHPHLDGLERRVALARTEVALAREAYKPDWRLNLTYGHRQAFADFIGVQAEIDLPWFTARRQDRRLAARLAEQTEAEARREDILRRHFAEARAYYADWRAALERLAEFDRAVVPVAGERVDAARAAYAAGRGGFSEVLAARRALLDAELLRLEQEVAVARALVQLQFFTD
jgi:outer membrane protein TolC